MNASNVEFISAQNKSKLVKIISYLSRGDYRNHFNHAIINEQVIRRPFDKNERSKTDGYLPSFYQDNNNNNRIIKGRSTPLRNDSNILFLLYKINNNINLREILQWW